MATAPSNLIPTRITQLPDAPVASEDGLLLYVYNGNTYKVRAGDLLSVTGVPLTRQVIAGTGMTGGGQLSANVTLSVAPKSINTALLTNTGVTPGVYGGGARVPVLTVDSTGRVVAATHEDITVSGYVPTTRKVVAGEGLSGGGALTGDVTLAVNLSNALPQNLYRTGAAGTSLSVARADHRHPALDLASDDQVDGLLGLSNGGTGRSLVMQPGAVIWSGADGFYVGPAGMSGQVLISGGAAQYTWGSALTVSAQPANVFYAGPVSGAPATTSFRNITNADLPDSGVVAAAYGSATKSAVITVNLKGVVTGVSEILTTPAFSSLTSKPTTLAGYGITDAAPLSHVGSGGTQHANATGAAAGFMSSTDKSKLDGIAPGARVGTVTSIGGTGTVSGLTLTGTVTTSGNLVLGGTLAVLPTNFASQAAATFLAAPSGAAGTPTFRTLLASDVPVLNQNTTGSAGSATNLIGGAASQIPYQSAAGTTVFLANGSAGQVLKSTGATAPVWGGLSGGTF